MQIMLSEPYYSEVNSIRLTEFPVADQFINPGVGISLYDFFVPLHGKEDYEMKKNTEMLPGSLNEKPELKESKVDSASLKQEGFGAKDKLEISSKDVSSERGLNNSILNAMKHAKIKTSELKYSPKEKKIKQIGQGQSKKNCLKDKFKLI